MMLFCKTNVNIYPMLLKYLGSHYEGLNITWVHLSPSGEVAPTSPAEKLPVGLLEGCARSRHDPSVEGRIREGTPGTPRRC